MPLAPDRRSPFTTLPIGGYVLVALLAGSLSPNGIRAQDPARADMSATLGIKLGNTIEVGTAHRDSAPYSTPTARCMGTLAALTSDMIVLTASDGCAPRDIDKGEVRSLRVRYDAGSR